MRFQGSRLGAALRPEGGSAAYSYYALAIGTGWRALVLDAFDVSLVGHAEGSSAHTAAKAMLASSVRPDAAADPLDGRWHGDGGGLSQAQLDFVGEQLAAAAAAGERVIIASHLGVLPALTRLDREMAGGMSDARSPC